MNQVYSGNYQSYQPSYQAPCMGQWAAQSYNQGSYSYYGSGPGHESYGRKTYSTPCMGQCNPPKLYADTFNYLTENLMKPVIEEVYQDLKSITAANTVTNNPAASKMGLQTQGQKALANAEPLSSGLIKGQLHDVSAVSPASRGHSGLMAPKSMARPMGSLYQANPAISRNGLNQA